MTFLSEMERIIKANGERGLEQLMFYRGLDLKLYRRARKDSVYDKVHNKNSGAPVEFLKDIQGLIAGDDFFPTTGQQAGVFKKAWLFTVETDINPGDEIEISRVDGKRMAYRVEERPRIGQTIEVFTKWELSGIM